MSVEVWVAIKSADYPNIHGRIVDVKTQLTTEYALLGHPLAVVYRQARPRKNLVLKPGILFRASLPVDVVNLLLDDVANGVPQSSVEVDDIRPINEPCVRVPLSLFMLLRGQEGLTEMQRKALVKSWAEDRRTGKGD